MSAFHLPWVTSWSTSTERVFNTVHVSEQHEERQWLVWRLALLTTDLERGLQLQQDGLAEEDLSGLDAEPPHLRLRHLDDLARSASSHWRAERRTRWALKRHQGPLEEQLHTQIKKRRNITTSCLNSGNCNCPFRIRAQGKHDTEWCWLLQTYGKGNPQGPIWSDQTANTISTFMHKLWWRLGLSICFSWATTTTQAPSWLD